jgi:hypothetical protein
MKAKLWLRIASALMAFHTLGHTFGALTWRQAPNAATADVINGMQTNHFIFMGRLASLASFYEGYGISMILVLLLVVVSLWLMSSSFNNSLAPKLLSVLTVFLLFLSVTELIYFFPMAAIITFLAAVATLIATIQIRKAVRE